MEARAAVTCPECGEVFEPHNGRQVYCSLKCQRIHSNWVTNEKARVKRLIELPIARAPRNCRRCNKQFLPIKMSNRWYCSDTCRNKTSHDNKKKRRTYVGSSDAKECERCKKPILATGLCYDCFNPGGRYIARAAWLFGDNRKRRLNPQAA